MSTDLGTYTHLAIAWHPSPSNIYTITLDRAPTNRLTAPLCADLIRALRAIERAIPPAGAPGAIVTRGTPSHYCTGLDEDEVADGGTPTAHNDGFYPLLATLLDLRVPTVALVAGVANGGGCPLALAHDYRVMCVDATWCMPPVDLGMHFDGLGALLRAKLGAATARKMLLEGYKWTGREAVAEGIVGGWEGEGWGVCAVKGGAVGGCGGGV